MGLTQVGQYADALEHLRHAVELKADDAAAWFDYGQALESSGDSREAHKAYRKVIDLDASSAYSAGKEIVSQRICRVILRRRAKK